MTLHTLASMLSITYRTKYYSIFVVPEFIQKGLWTKDKTDTKLKLSRALFGASTENQN